MDDEWMDNMDALPHTCTKTTHDSPIQPCICKGTEDKTAKKQKNTPAFLSCVFGSQAIKQMYVLVLGLDVLGNPFGLIRGLSEGVEAFFYEPYQVS